MKRLIFLDIDGVLNHDKFFKESKGELKYFDPDCIQRLNTLGDLGAEIVLASSWGYDGGRTEERLREAGLTLPIIGYTKKHSVNWICRGNEIEEWILENLDIMGTKFGSQCKSADYEYVILDDDIDMLYGQKDHFIRVDKLIGLTDEDIKKARVILKDPEIEKKREECEYTAKEVKQILEDFGRKMLESQEEMPTEFQKILNEHWWEMLDDKKQEE